MENPGVYNPDGGTVWAWEAHSGGAGGVLNGENKILECLYLKTETARKRALTAL